MAQDHARQCGEGQPGSVQEDIAVAGIAAQSLHDAAQKDGLQGLGGAAQRKKDAAVDELAAKRLGIDDPQPRPPIPLLGTQLLLFPVVLQPLREILGLHFGHQREQVCLLNLPLIPDRNQRGHPCDEGVLKRAQRIPQRLGQRCRREALLVAATACDAACDAAVAAALASHCLELNVTRVFATSKVARARARQK